MTFAPASTIHIPDPWRDAADTMLQQRARRVMVIGATDTGKSTLCRFLADRLLAAGLRVALVDADIGQKAIGPPTTVTLGYPAAGAEDWPEPAAFHFVGNTSPAGHFLPLTLGAARLAAMADADVVLVNTTGMVRGPGVPLKTFKIDAVRPDLIVAVARGQELAPILAANAHVRTLQIAPSPFARTKSREERETNRAAAFFRYFASATRHPFAWADVIVQPMVPAKVPAGLLCGLADPRGDDLGLGILAQVDGGMLLTTPVRFGDVRIMRPGAIRLDEEHRDAPA